MEYVKAMKILLNPLPATGYVCIAKAIVEDPQDIASMEVCTATMSACTAKSLIVRQLVPQAVALLVMVNWLLWRIP